MYIIEHERCKSIMQTQSRAVVPLLILILLALLCLFIARADAAEPAMEEVLAELRAAGGKLALTDGSGTVYLMEPDASNPEWIGYGRTLTWSPDGQAVVVGTHAWLDLHVGVQMALRDGPLPVLLDQTQWVPQQNRLLLFDAEQPGIYLSRQVLPATAGSGTLEQQSEEDGAVFSLSRESDLEALVTDGSLGIHGAQCVSSDGRRIAFVRRSADDLLAAIWALDLTTGTETPIALPRTAEVVRDYVYNFAWSPTGGDLLFVWATATDVASGPPDRWQIMRVRDGASAAEPLFGSAVDGNAMLPVWSPSGDAIAYVRTETDAALQSTPAIRLADPAAADAGDALLVLDGGDVLTSQLSWSPDGQVLYFSVRDRRTGISTLRLLTRDGLATPLVGDGDLFALGWLPYQGEVHLQPPIKAPPDGRPGTVSAEPGDLQAQVAYNRAGAVGYALSHCTEATPNCPVNISYAEVGGDCAHFVSHCLYAGGLSNYGSIGVGHNTSGTAWYVTGGIIIRAGNQHDWVLGGGRGTAKTSAIQLDQGDVMAYDWDGVNGWNHVAFIVQNDGRGDARVASHTRYGCDLDWSMGGAAVYEFMHVLAAPAAPRLPFPGDGAVITGTMPLLSWGAVGTAHDLRLASDEAFATPLIALDGLPSAQYALDAPLGAGEYFWRTRVHSSDGSSSWSPTWRFTLCPTPPAPPLTSPADGYSACAGTPLTFTWDTVLTATAGYELEWTDPVVGTQLFSATATSLTLPGGLTAGAHSWRVRAVNECGPGVWSVSRTTTGLAVPAAPVLRRPAVNAETLETLPTFTWDALTTAVSYTLQVAAVPGFDLPLVQGNTLTPSYTLTGSPLALGTYYWRVRAANSCGAGDWSEVRAFAVVDTLSGFLPLILKYPEPVCTESLANGGFESDSGWTLSGSTPPVYVTDQFVTETRSLRLGIVPPSGDASAYSSAYQAVTLPATASSATLGFWLQRHSADTSGDAQQAIILNESLGVERVLMNVLSDDGAWSHATFDLTPYLGRTIAVYFNVVNDGDGNRTCMYLDDVTLEVCP